MRLSIALALLLLGAAGKPGRLDAQEMINMTTPFQTMGSSFFENFGVNWSLQGPNFNANFNAAAPPPFGNFDPNSGLRTGIAFGNGQTRGTLGLNLGQGSSRTITSTAPSVTTMNGVPGSIQSQTIRPFVTGIVPVVGGQPAGFVPLASEFPSTGFGNVIPQEGTRSIQQAQQADLQRRMFKANQARQEKALNYFNRGQRAEAEGDKRKARANYRLALGSAEGLLRVEVIKRMRVNGWMR